MDDSDSQGTLHDRLLRAAVAQIRAKGAESFSLRETARSAGVDPAMVYRAFTDRADLVAQVALQAFARLAEAVQTACAHAAAGATDPDVARLRAMGAAYIAFAAANPTEFSVMFAGGRRENPTTTLPSAYDQLVALLDALASDARLSLPRDEAALVCWTAVHGAAWLVVEQALAGYPLSDPDAVTAVVVEHLLRSIVREPR